LNEDLLGCVGPTTLSVATSLGDAKVDGQAKTGNLDLPGNRRVEINGQSRPSGGRFDWHQSVE
jgi:hypothetical protein